MNDTNKTPDAVREAANNEWLEMLRRSAAKLAPVCAKLADETPVAGEPDPLWWERQSAIREASVILGHLAALDSRAGDAGEVERLRKGLERARSDLHLVTLHGSVRPMWEEAKAARDRVHEVLAATPVPAVDAVPAREALPRLTRSMMKAACKAHYGDDNIDGIDLTVDSINYTFAQGFARMWKGIRAALSHGEGR